MSNRRHQIAAVLRLMSESSEPLSAVNLISQCGIEPPLLAVVLARLESEHRLLTSSTLGMPTVRLAVPLLESEREELAAQIEQSYVEEALHRARMVELARGGEEIGDTIDLLRDLRAALEDGAQDP